MVRLVLLMAVAFFRGAESSSFSRIGANTVFTETEQCVLIAGFYRMSFTIQLPVAIPILPPRLNATCSNSNAKVSRDVCEFLRPLLRDFELKHARMTGRANRLIETITELVPHTVSGKGKRGLINILGRGMQWLAGSACDDDVKHLQVVLKRVATRVAELGETQHIVQSLQSYAHLNDQRNHDLARALHTTMAGLHNIAEESLTMGAELEHLRDIYQNFTNFLISYNNMYQNLLDLKYAIVALTQGHLSPELIGRDLMQDMLMNVRRELATKRSHLDMLHTTQEVYRHARYAFARHGQILVVSLKLPIVSKQFFQPFTFYRISKLDLPVGDDSGHSTRISLKERFIALQGHSREHTFLTFESTEPKCESDGSFMANDVSTQFYLLNSSTCLAALIRDDTQMISATCAFTYEISAITPAIRRYNDTHALISGVQKFETVCQGELNRTVHEGCKTACVIETFCGCSIRSNDILLPGRYDDKCRPWRGDSLPKSHAINVAFLSKMFSPEKMAELFASSFLEQEPKIVLPKLQIYNATDFLSHDEQFSFKLKHIIDALQNNKTIYKSSLNKLLAEKEDFFESPEIDAWQLLAEGNHTSWVTLSAFVLAVIAMALTAVLFVKLKTISAALILLRQPVSALALASSELNFDYFLDVVKVNHTSHVRTNTTARLDLEIDIPYTYAMFATLIGLGILSIATLIATTCNRGRGGRAEIWVQIRNKTHAVEVRLLQLGLFNDMYEFSFGEPDKWEASVQNNRFCRPTLKIRGLQACVRDKICQERVIVPKNVNLSMMKARALKKIVPYKCSIIVYLQTGENRRQILANTKCGEARGTSIYQEPMVPIGTARQQMASAPSMPTMAIAIPTATQDKLYPNLGKQVCYLNDAFDGHAERPDDATRGGQRPTAIYLGI